MFYFREKEKEKKNYKLLLSLVLNYLLKSFVI